MLIRPRRSHLAIDEGQRHLGASAPELAESCAPSEGGL